MSEKANQENYRTYGEWLLNPKNSDDFNRDLVIIEFERLCGEANISPKHIANAILQLKIAYHLGINFGERFTKFICLETIELALQSAADDILVSPSKVQLVKYKLRNQEQPGLGGAKSSVVENESLWSYQRNAMLRASYLQPFVYTWALEKILEFSAEKFENKNQTLEDLHIAMLCLFRDDVLIFDELILGSISSWLRYVKSIELELGPKRALAEYLKCLRDERMNDAVLQTLHSDFSSKRGISDSERAWKSLMNIFLGHPAKSIDDLRNLMKNNYQVLEKAPKSRSSRKLDKRFSIDELNHINWMNYGDYIN